MAANDELMACAWAYANVPRDVDGLRDDLVNCLQRQDCRHIVSVALATSSLVLSFLKSGSKNHIDVLQALFENGMSIDVQDERGRTALMCASGEGHEDCVCFLLERGASVNAQERSGWTALMYAVDGDQTDFVTLLLESGANPDLQDTGGMTALMLAGAYDNQQIAQLLLNHGADTDLKDKDRKTALDHAFTEETKAMIRNHVNNRYILK